MSSWVALLGRPPRLAAFSFPCCVFDSLCGHQIIPGKSPISYGITYHHATAPCELWPAGSVSDSSIQAGEGEQLEVPRDHPHLSSGERHPALSLPTPETDHPGWGPAVCSFLAA